MAHVAQGHERSPKRKRKRYNMRQGRQVRPDHARPWKDFSSYTRANGATLRGFRKCMCVCVSTALWVSRSLWLLHREQTGEGREKVRGDRLGGTGMAYIRGWMIAWVRWACRPRGRVSACTWSEWCCCSQRQRVLERAHTGWASIMNLVLDSLRSWGNSQGEMVHQPLGRGLLWS